MGRTAITKANSAAPFRNNGGSILSPGGNIASNSPITKQVVSVANPRKPYASDIAALSVASFNGNTGHIHIKAALSTGAFAQQRAGQYVALGLSTFLAGVANTVLQSPASIYRNRYRNAKVSTKTYTLKSITAGWNRTTGAYLSAPTQQIDYFGNSSASPGRDDSLPTSAIPGEFVITDGSKNPVLKDYAPRTT